MSWLSQTGVLRTISIPTTARRETPAASLASGLRAKTSPSSLTTDCTRYSTAARSRRASRSATAGGSSSTRRWALSPRSSTSRRSPPCAVTSPSRTAATRRPAPPCGRTRSRPSGRRPTVSIALGHNGNLTNTRELAAMLPPESGFAGLQATSDTDVLTELIAGGRRGRRRGRGGLGPHPAAGARRLLPRLHGREHAVRGA